MSGSNNQYDFIFSAATGNPGGDSPWYRLADLVDPVCFILTGIFSATIVIRYSNDGEDDQSANPTKAYVTDSYTMSAPDGPRQIPPGTAKFVQFGASSYVSGSPKVSWAKARFAGNGAPENVSVQGTRYVSPVPQQDHY